MEQKPVKRQAWVIPAVFAALAVLAGPVRGYTAEAFSSAMQLQMLAGGALSGAVAGCALLLLGMARGQGMLRGKQWQALLVLLLPQWFQLLLTAPGVASIPGLHSTRWTIPFMLSLAAPLWLGLLSSMEWIDVEVPRAAVGAGIAGLGAAYLALPGDYGLAWNQAPMVALQLILSIAVVFSWAFAAPRLGGVGTAVTAGSFLLLSALMDAGMSLLFERPSWQPLDWHGLWAPLLLEAAVAACVGWLWFWLLQRMPLAGFSMQTLAKWTASVLPGFALFGFLQLREDAVVAISLGAIAVALRARVAEEQPTALGLNSE